jgi:hypothetical protein
MQKNIAITVIHLRSTGSSPAKYVTENLGQGSKSEKHSSTLSVSFFWIFHSPVTSNQWQLQQLQSMIMLMVMLVLFYSA